MTKDTNLSSGKKLSIIGLSMLIILSLILMIYGLYSNTTNLKIIGCISLFFGILCSMTLVMFIDSITNWDNHTALYPPV